MSYTRSIGRKTTNAMPSWRAAMSATNTIYRVGQTPAGSGLQSAWVWPSGSEPSRWPTSPGDRVKWGGFGGAVFLEGQGPHGAWVFNETGEQVWQNNAKQWRVNDGTLAPWTQPQYHTTLAACEAADDDVYYSPTDAANPSIVAATRSFANDTALLAQPWDGGFPMALAGWVWRRKQQKFTLKNNQPHWFRYNTPRAVPARIARTARDIIVCKESNLHGPFAQAWRPSGYPDSAMHTDLWPSGRVRQYIFWQDTDTGAWSRITAPAPDLSIRDAFSDHCVLDSVNRRLYYWAPGLGTYFVALSQGIASAAVSGITATTGSSAAPEFDRGNTCLTDGHPTGRRLWYFRSGTGGRGQGTANRLGMLDLDNNTVYDLNLSGQGMDPGLNWSMQIGYDASTNRVLITTLGLDTGPRFHWFVVPADPTNAANYAVNTATLSFAAGVSLEPSFGHKPTGERGMLNVEGGVIFITQEDEAMLAFRPAF